MIGEASVNLEHNWRTYIKILAASGALALAGCGGERESRTKSAQSPSPTSAAKTEEHTLVFDDLGGGSSIIRVYPGVNDTEADKKANGTFNTGDSVPADCKTTGRTIKSDTSVGEENRSSADWVRIEGSPGETQYATAVYAQNPQKLLEQLPDC
jgi:hypothetical protein